MAVALAKARELGYEVVACASTGNLANAVAAHAAAAGLESYVFIPADLEEQKVLATGVYGTHLVAVRGSYDDVNRLCTELSVGARLGVRQREPAAVLRGGLEDARRSRSPSSSASSCRTAWWLRWPPARCSRRSRAGSRSGSSWASSRAGLPHFNGAQATGCSPVATAFEDGKDFCRPVKPDTIAKSLAIGNPADGPYALELARRSGGSVESVSDQEIRDGIRLLAETTGIFTETAGGVTTAVLRKLAEQGAIGPDERVVVVITGDGLKTLDAVRDTFAVHEIEPTVGGVRGGCCRAARRRPISWRPLWR